MREIAVLGFFIFSVIIYLMFGPVQAFSKILPEPTPTPTLTPTQTPTPTPTNTPTPTDTPTPTPKPTSTPTPVPPTKAPVVQTDDIWNKLAECESKSNWSIDSGNGYYGGLQFSQGAWESVGGAGNPAHASRDEQITRAKTLQERRGWGVWGECAKKLGLN